MVVDLAVASDGPTRRRLQRHLPPHGIAVHHLPVGAGIEEIGAVEVPGHRQFDVGFVYPARTVEGDVITASLDLPWVNDRSDILTTRNKAGALSRLEGAGIPIPRTIHVSSPADEEAVIDAYQTFDGPVVLKPNTTTKGIGHVLLRDIDSLRGVVDYIDLIHSFPATRDRSFLLQEYLPEARDLRLTLLDGTVAGAVERRLDDDGEGAWVKNVHRGATAASIKPPEDAIDLAESAADQLDIAILGVDIMLGEDGPVVLEVNARPTIDQVEKYGSDFYDRLASLIKATAAEP